MVRHRIPVVMIVGNNAGWALEKHPMRMLYGYDVVADLAPTHYDEIVVALGGGGETVTRADPGGPGDRSRDGRRHPGEDRRRRPSGSGRARWQC